MNYQQILQNVLLIRKLREVFPRKSVLLKTYMLGCFYLFYQTIKTDNKKKRIYEFQNQDQLFQETNVNETYFK
ncbi:unnamed protein product (macronuclear) [Paramecium tetraurelia]|uniref:Uncharacterized protein n=1 Tax=Paramecium tetraurelia TaxID=5888 RepID=A0DS41_PARTE|nr:uncharacterized protein GSPATT00019562001 [Paramecium tetraurelia]CAK85858.1 unnamed protein product [Paramecium tetraurelia]|eukprot:XP_001453255.1 hypothetical protein (macronuclear) [Paramecium tetraurelia strain d4-2]